MQIILKLKLLLMKKFIFAVIMFITFFSTASAQFDLEKLFVGGTIGYAKPIGDFSDYAKGGLTYTGEIGYSLNDNFAVGLGYTKTATVAIDTSLNSGLLGLNVYSLPSYYAKAWYTFMTGNFKPYAGLGLGFSQSGTPDVTVNGELIKGKKRGGLGAHLELGFVVSGFNLSYSFNMNAKTPKELNYNPKVQDLSVLYHRFNIGYRYSF